MPLQKLLFRPGINKEGTDYSNEGGWFDSNLVRFRKNLPETQACNARQVDWNVLEVFLVQPPIFSGRFFLKRTKLESNQPPSLL